MDIKKQVEALRQMTPGRLREKYLELFGEPARSGNKDFLAKRLAWRIQSLAEGSLSVRARQRAAELARDADIRTTIPKAPVVTPGAKAGATTRRIRTSHTLVPGTVLTRQYRDRQIEVKVLPNGFDWDGQVYRSLSAVAKAVTGSHWNGYLFFNLMDGEQA